MNKGENQEYLKKGQKPDLVIGIAESVGTDLGAVDKAFKSELHDYGYKIKKIKISQDIIPLIVPQNSINKKREEAINDNYIRIKKSMEAGTEARSINEVALALGATYEISKDRRKPNHEPTVYIIDSLKHRAEVGWLRKTYQGGFYLLGVYTDVTDRDKYLDEIKKIHDETKRNELLEKDQNESDKTHGQHTAQVYELSDFFLYNKCIYNTKEDGSLVILDDGSKSIRLERDKRVERDLKRFLRLIFNDPQSIPTFDEHAMFFAFATAARSADLARQVGAVIANETRCSIHATGANDNPYVGGGNYPYLPYKGLKNEDESKKENSYPPVLDVDHTDDPVPNKRNIKEMVENVVDMILREYYILPHDVNPKQYHPDQEVSKKLLEELLLKKSRLKDITEYSRSIHAEMEAILSCSRNSVDAKGMTLYCTTFPCHNCAKHIIDSGITRVVYIEPYPKSKTVDLFKELIDFPFLEKKSEEKKSEEKIEDKKVKFEPFVGVGPRLYIDLFSLNLGSGDPKYRKDEVTDEVLKLDKNSAYPRLILLETSLLNRERKSIKDFINVKKIALKRLRIKLIQIMKEIQKQKLLSP